MNAFSPLACVVFTVIAASAIEAHAVPCPRCAAPMGPPAQHVCYADDDEQPSWIFSRSTYTHDPNTGARVAQYQRLPAIEPLDDERLVTSRYHRIQTNLRGTNGSTESYYDVQAWGNGRGGIDAEWERFHNAWKESYLQGGSFNQQGPNFGNGWGPGWGNGSGPGWNNGWGPGGGSGWNNGWGNGWNNGFPGLGGPGWRNSGPVPYGQSGNTSGRRGNGSTYNGHGHAGDWN